MVKQLNKAIAAEESLKRIRNRVEKGGHDIPSSDVLRRFEKRFQDVRRILFYCNEAVFFDNDNGFRAVAEYRNGEILLIGDYLPCWMAELKSSI